MTDDLPALCERLNVQGNPLCWQAADVIKSLSAELEQAKRERDEALAAIDAVATRGPGMTLVEAVKGVLGILAGTETELAEAESALAQMREERDRLLKVCEWYEQEITKRFACVRCGEEPHRGSDLYSTVCPSCRRCYRCAEPSCPTCGDAEGMRQRAVQAAADNDRLRALMAASLRVECSEACRREVGKG